MSLSALVDNTRMKMTGVSCGACVLALMLGAGASDVRAQTTNPNTVSFLPSVSHDGLGRDGEPLVTRYDLELYRLGAPQPSLVVDLGKPAPDADGYLRAAIETRVADATLENTTLEIRIAAVGPGGVARSGASNLFELNNCAYVMPGSVEVAGSGGRFEASVMTSDRCVWNATSASSWLSKTSPTANVGSGQIHVTVAANPTSSGRLGAIRVGPQLVLVFQAPGP